MSGNEFPLRGVKFGKVEVGGDERELEVLAEARLANAPTLVLGGVVLIGASLLIGLHTFWGAALLLMGAVGPLVDYAYARWALTWFLGTYTGGREDSLTGRLTSAWSRRGV